VRLSEGVVGLHLALFREKIENHCCICQSYIHHCLRCRANSIFWLWKM